MSSIIFITIIFSPEIFLLLLLHHSRPGNKDARHAPGVCVWELAGLALYWRFGIGVYGSDAGQAPSTCACWKKKRFFLLLVIFYKSKTTVMLQTSQSKTKSTQPSIAALFSRQSSVENFSRPVEPASTAPLADPVVSTEPTNAPRTPDEDENTRWRWKATR